LTRVGRGRLKRRLREVKPNPGSDGQPECFQKFHDDCAENLAEERKKIKRSRDISHLHS